MQSPWMPLGPNGPQRLVNAAVRTPSPAKSDDSGEVDTTGCSALHSPDDLEQALSESSSETTSDFLYRRRLGPQFTRSWAWCSPASPSGTSSKCADCSKGDQREMFRQPGIVVKPVKEPRKGKQTSERAFYRRLAVASGVEAALQSFVPRYYGEHTAQELGVPLRDPSRVCLVLGDITAGMRRPAIADLKMGTRKFERSNLSPAELELRREKALQRSSGSLGWIIEGISTGVPSCDMNDEEGKACSPEEAVQHLVRYLTLAGDADRIRAVAESFFKDLAALAAWFEAPGRSWQFFNSSLLFAYDLDMPTEDDVQTQSGPRGGSGAVVKMIDFDHAVPLEGSDVDDSGYTVGLHSLMSVLLSLAHGGGDNFCESISAKAYGKNEGQAVRIASPSPSPSAVAAAI